MKRSNGLLALASRIFRLKQVVQQPQKPQTTQKVIQFPSLNIGFELVRERLTNQSETLNTLDTKASFVLGSSTILIGAVILNHSQIPSCHFFFFMITPDTLRLIPLLLLLSYLIGVLSAFQAYRIRGSFDVPKPRTIYDRYLTKPEEETKAANFMAMIYAYEENTKLLKIKGRWTTAALTSLAILAVLLALPLLFQVIC